MRYSRILTEVKMVLHKTDTNLSKSEEPFLAYWPHPMLGEALSMFGSGERRPEREVQT